MNLRLIAGLSAIVVSSVLLAACATNSTSTATDPGPAPSASRQLDDHRLLDEARHAYLAHFPKTEDGKPIVLAPESGRPEGIAVAYDATGSDAITRWGACVSLVTACYGKSDLASCITQVPQCADDDGGLDCCPRACIYRYEAELAEGVTARKAVRRAFLGGDCVPGMTREASAGGVPTKVVPTAH